MPIPQCCKNKRKINEERNKRNVFLHLYHKNMIKNQLTAGDIKMGKHVELFRIITTLTADFSREEKETISIHTSTAAVSSLSNSNNIIYIYNLYKYDYMYILYFLLLQFFVFMQKLCNCCGHLICWCCSLFCS